MTARWLLASPGTGPHVREAARALAEASVLDTVVVPMAAEARGLIHNLLRAMPATSSLLGRRRLGTPKEVSIATRAWPELLRVVSARLDRDGRLTDAIWDWTASDFARHSARIARSPITAVYAYEYSALELFDAAKRRGLRCVLEVNSCDAEEVMTLHERFAALDPKHDSAYSRRLRRLAPRRAERRRQEWALADAVIVNSEVTRDSMRRAGRDTTKVSVVPLGCPSAVQRACVDRSDDPLRIVFVGTFGVRKGAHVLVDALRALGPCARVDVFGTCELPRSAWLDVADRLRFMGSVAQQELFDLLSGYDLLVLPTLSEGFGMSVSEALAHGVPVLTTEAAGSSMLVEGGRNGWIVPAGDASALAATLERAIAQPSLVRSMRDAAQRSAADWQWSHYREALRRALGVAGTA